MRLLLILTALFLASPASAQTLTVSQCEETARDTDSAVQKYLKQSNPDSDAEADATEEISGFEDFCVKPYTCPAFGERWKQLRGDNLLDPDRYKGKPMFFTDTFASLRKECQR